MKNSRLFTLTFALLTAVSVHADQPLAGNVTVTGGAATGNLFVTGVVDVDGNSVTFGTQGASYGAGLLYADSATDTLNFHLNRSTASWLWQHTTVAAMRLDSAHQLILYQADGTTAGLTFLPASNTIKLGPHANGTLTADANGVITAGGGFNVAGNFTNTSGTLTGGSTGLNLNAGGTNQNITLSSSTAGDIIFKTNGFERARITSSGNIGIGTTSPNEALTVIKDGVDELGASLRTVATFRSGNGGKGLYIGYDTTEQLAALFPQGANSGITFWSHNGVNWGERLRIHTNGNVGIGTSAPVHSLDVIGNFGAARIFARGPQTASVPAYSFEADSNTGMWGTSDDTLRFSTAGSQRVHIDASGKVGIGTTSPVVMLDVNGPIHSRSGYIALHDGTTMGGGLFFEKSVMGAGTSLSPVLYSETGNALSFMTNGSVTKRMVIDTTGNVGIGTSTPDAKLHVNGGQIRVTDGGSTYDLGNDTTGTYLRHYASGDSFRVLRASGDETIRFSSSGNVGIGTAATYNGSGVRSLTINAPLYPVLALQTAGTFLGYVVGYSDHLAVMTTGARHLTLETDDTERLRVTSSGNVGIGTTNPAHRLAVNGTIRAKEVIVDNTEWADYVFEEDYRLTPLAEIEGHIKSKKHLPGIPSAAEVAEHGVSMGDMQAKLLSKVEELTLHLIAQEKHQLEQQKEIAALRQQIGELTSRAQSNEQ